MIFRIHVIDCISININLVEEVQSPFFAYTRPVHYPMMSPPTLTEPVRHTMGPRTDTDIKVPTQGTWELGYLASDEQNAAR